MKTIAIDFDGVIHKYSRGWHDGTCYDDVMEGAENTIFKLMMSFKVFIFTTRNTEDVKEWMDSHTTFSTEIITTDSPFWDKPGIIGITNRKLAAVAYIDDRGLRFTNWNDIERYFI